MIRLFITLVSFFFLCFGSLYAEINLDPRGNRGVNNWTRYASIRLESKKTFFKAKEKIPVHIKIKNKGYQVIRIYPYSQTQQSFKLFLSDQHGKEILQKFNPISWNKQERGEQIFNIEQDELKEIILGVGESFERIIYLNDFYNASDFKNDQEYRLWLYYYPSQRNFFVRSENTILFRIAENAFPQEKFPSNKKRNTLSISPEETVYLFLSSEMQKNWPNHLKYINLKKYITAYNNYAARYLETAPEQRKFILEEFSAYLRTQPAASLKKFRIIRTEIERDEGGEIIDDGRHFVDVLGVRENINSLTRYEYRYTLEKENNGFWKIIYVDAKILP